MSWRLLVKFSPVFQCQVLSLEGEELCFTLLLVVNGFFKYSERQLCPVYIITSKVIFCDLNFREQQVEGNFFEMWKLF